MFTGLIETVGTVRALRRTGAVYCLSLEAPKIVPDLALGQSVSVSGACLTVTACHGDVFDVEMMPETMSRTWFGDRLKPGIPVNLERALRPGDRLDGHIVLGHVDGRAKLAELRGNDQTREAFFSAPPELLRGIVPKGSVALDGVSLTVIDVGNKMFSVGLIPTTLASCTLGELRVGMSVNLETDILGKYVERLMAPLPLGNPTSEFSGQSLSMEELRNLGY